MRYGILYPLPLSSNNKQKQYFKDFVKKKLDSQHTYYYLNIWNTPDSFLQFDDINIETIDLLKFTQQHNYQLSTKFIYKTYLQYKDYLINNPSGLGKLQSNIFQNHQYNKEIEKYLFLIIKWIKEYGIQKIWCLDIFFLKFLEELSYSTSVNIKKITQINYLMDVYIIKDLNYHQNTNIFSFKEILECINCISCKFNEPFANIIIDDLELYRYFLKLGIHNKYYSLDKSIAYNNLIKHNTKFTIPTEFTNNITKLLTVLLTYQKCNSPQDWDIISDNYQSFFKIPIYINVELPTSIYSFVPSAQLNIGQTSFHVNSSLQLEFQNIITSIISNFKLLTKKITHILLSWCQHCKLRLLPEKILPKIIFQLKLHFATPDVKLNYSQLGNYINISTILHTEVYNYINTIYQKYKSKPLQDLNDNLEITNIEFIKFGNFKFQIEDIMDFNTKDSLQNCIGFKDITHTPYVEKEYSSHLDNIINILKNNYDNKNIKCFPIVINNDNVDIENTNNKILNSNNMDEPVLQLPDYLDNDEEILILENDEDYYNDINVINNNDLPIGNDLENDNNKILEESDSILSLQDIEKYKNKLGINTNVCVNTINNINNINIKSYKELFNKYYLNLSDPNKKLNYYIKKYIKTTRYLNNKLFAHLHCYNIDEFNKYYGEYYCNIVKYYSIIITYSIGNIVKLDKKIKSDCVILEVENKGLDIGPKLCVIDYLNKNKISYDYLLFLHSKTDLNKRYTYFHPLIGSLKQINYIRSIIYKYDAIFPNFQGNKVNGDWNVGKYFINNTYYQQINKFLKINHKTNYFIEGNCYILSKKIVNYVWNTNNIKLFYNLLNTTDTFDYNWFKLFYNLNDSNNNIEKCYLKYKNNNLIGNYLKIFNKPKISDLNIILNGKYHLSNQNLADGAIEHVWERLFLNLCIDKKLKFKLISENDFLQPISTNNSFNLNLYKFLNNIQDYNNSIENIEKQKKKAITFNEIYSLEQILNYLPLNFNINKYVLDNNLQNLNKYQIISHAVSYFKLKTSEKYTRWSSIIKNNNSIHSFLYVFPQFHEIPENNKFWGKGFTEWWNVSKTYQVSKEHIPIHPHHDIGYYNLLDKSTRERWTNYANNYGFDGFIYCHFWFDKGIIMNKPLDKILEDNHPNKPWFLNWINENWTKRWDGGNNEILLGINISKENCVNHFKGILKYLKHHNYYKIDNKPCLGVYRCKEIPQYYIETFNFLAKKVGFNGITFVNTLNMNWDNVDNVNLNTYYDLEMEYPPNYCGNFKNSGKWNNIINKDKNDNVKYRANTLDTFKNNNNVIHYFDIRKKYKNIITTQYNLTNTNNKSNTNKTNKKTIVMRGCFPCWDNLPRHANLSSHTSIFLNSNTLDFYLTLLKQYLLLKKENPLGQQYHFINAMNEWAEQCVMEPSIQNEYSFLNAHKLAKMTNLDLINESMIDNLINYNSEISNNNSNLGNTNNQTQTFKKYPNLFNKYLMGCSNYQTPIEYELINENLAIEFKSKYRFCHIHCYNINKFEEIFGSYILNIKKHYSVIITYSIGDIDFDILDFTILKIINKGVDIGGKINMIKYLLSNNIDFHHILFLHSKTNITKRLEYFNPLIKDELIIVNNINKIVSSDNIYGLFPNLLTEDLEPKYSSNKVYHNEILDYLGCTIKKQMEFSEGNCMILRKEVLLFIWNNKLELFYNILNDTSTFDVNWCRLKYGQHNKSNNELFNDFINSSDYLKLNNDNTIVGNNFGNKSNNMPDGMVEHVFERIWLNIILHLNKEYCIL